MVALQQEYHLTVLSDISKINADLAQIANQRAQKSAIQIQAHTLAAEQYNHIRTHARSLYGVFEYHFQTVLCPCKVPHNASLRLRQAPINRPDDRRLNVLFDSNSPVCALEFESVSSKSHSCKEPSRPSDPAEDPNAPPEVKSERKLGRIGNAFRSTARTRSFVMVRMGNNLVDNIK